MLDISTIPALAVIIVASIVGIFIIIAIYRVKIIRDAALVSMADEINGKLKGNRITGEIDNIPYEIIYIPQSKNTPEKLKIRVYGYFAETFSIRNETWFDRLARKIHLVREFQTGDSEFDSKYYFEFGKQSFFEFFFMDEKKRKYIENILNRSINSLHVRKKYCQVMIEKFSIKDIKPAWVSATLKNLAEFSRIIPGESADLLSRPSMSTNAIMAAILISLGIIALAGGVLFAYSFNVFMPVEPSFIKSILFALPYSVVLTVAGALLFFYFLGKRSDIHKLILVFTLMMFLSTTLAGIGYFFFSNGYLDESHVRTSTVQVYDKKTKSDKNGRDYYLLIDDWRHENDRRWFKVNSSFYNHVKNKQRVKVATRKGYHDIEWLVSYSFVEPE